MALFLFKQRCIRAGNEHEGDKVLLLRLLHNECVKTTKWMTLEEEELI